MNSFIHFRHFYWGFSYFYYNRSFISLVGIPPMNFTDFQIEAFGTALPKAKTLTYMLIGLTNEAGETAGKLKKVLRGDKKLDDVKADIAAELGDVLWYVA